MLRWVKCEEQSSEKEETRAGAGTVTHAVEIFSYEKLNLEKH